MTKNQVRLRVFKFLAQFDSKIKTKFSNICAKTGQYSVPDELFQKRTPRKNRVLISWKNVRDNNLTIRQLSSFTGGVVVEFINEDFFEECNQNNPTFIELKKRLGSDEIVSSIITIRSESGSSSSQVQRNAFDMLVRNTRVFYKGNTVTITRDNFKSFGIKKTGDGGTGNEKWTGFLFVSIKGGQQDTIESHSGNQTIFNPACEFATEEVGYDLDLVMAYFALISIDTNTLSNSMRMEYNIVKPLVENQLRESYYDNSTYTGNLLDYCKTHPSMRLVPGKLYDPIQVEEIHIMDFAVDNKEDSRNIDFTHDEAVLFEKYYWDYSKCCILSPARPTNVFWSKHLSNMMQQNFSLDGFFKHEEEILERRKRLLGE